MSTHGACWWTVPALLVLPVHLAAAVPAALVVEHPVLPALPRLVVQLLVALAAVHLAPALRLQLVVQLLVVPAAVVPALLVLPPMPRRRAGGRCSRHGGYGSVLSTWRRCS
jgi:hypothetical protein